MASACMCMHLRALVGSMNHRPCMQTHSNDLLHGTSATHCIEACTACGRLPLAAEALDATSYCSQAQAPWAFNPFHYPGHEGCKLAVGIMPWPHSHLLGRSLMSWQMGALKWTPRAGSRWPS